MTPKGSSDTCIGDMAYGKYSQTGWCNGRWMRHLDTSNGISINDSSKQIGVYNKYRQISHRYREVKQKLAISIIFWMIITNHK